MFESFSSVLHLTPLGQSPKPPWRESSLISQEGYEEWSQTFSGCTFDFGLYRAHTLQSGTAAMEWIQEEFPEFAARAIPFGFDWQGRQFAIDHARIQNGHPLTLILEPGSGEVLEIPANFHDFHEKILLELKNEALLSDFFSLWRSSVGALDSLGFSECVGYRVPLFLGGEDEVGNLEVGDISVYLHTCAQLRQGLLVLGPDKSVTSVVIKDPELS